MDVGATFTQAEIDEEPFEVISEAEVLAPPSMDLRDLSKEEVETIRAVLERHRILECEEISYMRWERWTGMGMDKLPVARWRWWVQQGVYGLYEEESPLVLCSNMLYEFSSQKGLSVCEHYYWKSAHIFKKRKTFSWKERGVVTERLTFSLALRIFFFISSKHQV